MLALLSKFERVFFLFRVSFAESNLTLAEERREAEKESVILAVLRKFPSLRPSGVCATRWRLNAKESSQENEEWDEESGIAERAGKGKIREGSSTRR